MTDAWGDTLAYDRKVKFFFQSFLGDRVPNELKPENSGDMDTCAWPGAVATGPLT